jgi:membrane-associated protease RseP (regulator of RpoE activity)
MIHPIAFAGWAGLLVTALNLIPVGQLDGGHILYALLGDKARKLYPFMLGATVLMGFAWQGWWLWSGLLLLFGRMYDQPLDQVTTLDRRRKVLAVCGLILFILVFTPVPLLIVSP